MRRLASAAGTRVNALPYLSRWLILASLIGVIAGLGAVAFYEALRLSTHFFLAYLAGYHVPTPAGEGGASGSGSYARPWAIPLVVVAGALVSGWLVFSWAPEAEGHGTDSAIDAVHHNPRGIRLRAVVIKILASAFTIGSGGSGGREGPTAQISAGFGSLLARALDLSPEDGRIAVSVGIGSGIGAIFGAPLGGAVLAAEVVYREDFETSALVPGIFASVVAYAIFGAFFGYHALFAIPGGYHFEALQLAWFAIIGVVCAGLGLLYSKVFYAVAELTQQLPFSPKLRPASGALGVGLLALWLPEVLGTGYGWVQKGLNNDLAHIPLYIILLLPFARIAATALSIGTGGSGGVFGPGMVIGAFSGLAVWRVLSLIFPSVGHNPSTFIVVGMMALFGGISRAPLAVMIMVAEMTGSVGMLAPAMVAVAISTFIVGRADDSIYRSQLRNREESPGARLQSALPGLERVRVGDAARPPLLVLRHTTPVAEAIAQLRNAKVPGAPVVDDNGLFLGTVDEISLSALDDHERAGPVARAVDTTAPTISSGAGLGSAVEVVAQTGAHWATVTAQSRQVVGILAISDIMTAYRGALNESLDLLSRVTGNAVSVQERIGPRSAVLGRPLRDAGLPSGCILVTVRRGDHVLFPNASTVLAEGDLITALATPATAEAVALLLCGEDRPSEARERPGPMV